MPCLFAYLLLFYTLHSLRQTDETCFMHSFLYFFLFCLVLFAFACTFCFDFLWRTDWRLVPSQQTFWLWRDLRQARRDGNPFLSPMLFSLLGMPAYKKNPLGRRSDLPPALASHGIHSSFIALWHRLYLLIFTKEKAEEEGKGEAFMAERKRKEGDMQERCHAYLLTS